MTIPNVNNVQIWYKLFLLGNWRWQGTEVTVLERFCYKPGINTRRRCDPLRWWFDFLGVFRISILLCSSKLYKKLSDLYGRRDGKTELISVLEARGIASLVIFTTNFPIETNTERSLISDFGPSFACNWALSLVTSTTAVSKAFLMAVFFCIINGKRSYHASWIAHLANDSIASELQLPSAWTIVCQARFATRSSILFKALSILRLVMSPGLPSIANASSPRSSGDRICKGVFSLLAWPPQRLPWLPIYSRFRLIFSHAVPFDNHHRLLPPFGSSMALPCCYGQSSRDHSRARSCNW